MNKLIYYTIIAILLCTSCQKKIETKEDLIYENLKVTSPQNSWEKLSIFYATYNLQTVINENIVNEETKVITSQEPDLQKIETYKNNTLETIILTNNKGSNLIKFKNDAFLGINSIPKDLSRVSPILQVKEQLEKYVFLDTVWDNKPTYFLTSEINKDTFIFDKKTTLLTAYISESNYGQSITRYHDYREINGYLLPFKKSISVAKAKYTQNFTYKEIKINQSIAKDNFELKPEWKPVGKGTLVPSFTLPSVDQETNTITSEILKGKITLLDFWATWCQPCIKEFPMITKQYQKYKDDGFQVVSISVDKNISQPRKFLQKKPFAWNLSLFSEGEFNSELAKQYQLIALPKPILVDTNGKILAIDDELRGEKLETVLDSIFLNKKKTTE